MVNFRDDEIVLSDILVWKWNIRADVYYSAWPVRTMIRQRGIWRIPRRVFRENIPRIKIVRPILHAASSREYRCCSHTRAEKMAIILRIVRWDRISLMSRATTNRSFYQKFAVYLHFLEKNLGSSICKMLIFYIKFIYIKCI